MEFIRFRFFFASSSSKSSDKLAHLHSLNRAFRIEDEGLHSLQVCAIITV